jgi:NAD+-dependent secondary alcohol dehydrogenase Adh1
MKAALLYEYDTSLSNPDFVKLEEVPEPKLINDTDVLVRIGGAGVCRTDLHVIEGIWRQKVDVKLPYILGHENAGWVEEVGKSVHGFKKGDPVICHPLISNCHALEARRGHDMHVDGMPSRPCCAARSRAAGGSWQWPRPRPPGACRCWPPTAPPRPV